MTSSISSKIPRELSSQQASDINGTSPTKSPASIKLQRRTKADMDAICKVIVEVMEEENPMIVRQMFYQLDSPLERT